FEVCAADTVVSEGVSEVQTIDLNNATVSPFKRPIGFTLKVGDEETAPIWTAQKNILGLSLNLGSQKIANWRNVANQYLLGTSFVLPSTADIAARLRGLPSLGAGG